LRSVVSFIALFATWVTLSGHFSPYFLASGAACSALAVWLMRRLRVFGEGAWPLDPLRLVALYTPWLVWQVVKANFDVARRVWAPKMNIEPQLVRVPCRLKTEAGLALLANSITLTPGTVTIAIEGDELVVHSLSDAATVAVQGPGMQDRIAAMERAS
jgi:multicomponent Na+:H+ antiporter subunit E